MARNIQCPHCREMVRIKWRFRWKLMGVSFGSALGWLVGSFRHVIDYTFVGLILTPFPTTNMSLLTTSAPPSAHDCIR